MTNYKPNLGFIGLGQMGQGFTKCLINAGYQVTGYDLEHQKIDQAVEHGVIPAKNSREVTESSDIIMTSVTTTQAVEDVVFGPDGVQRCDSHYAPPVSAAARTASTIAL